MANSINTNISAYFAQANISAASSASSASVSRLSSGNRIVKASDDVAALSTGTSLRTQVTALKTALTNTAQGTSLLQVADGALSQVTEILQRQKAIALQAGSGSLTDTDRGYLDQEFQALSTEIDRLSGTTNFNGVKLLDGGLSQAAKVATSTSQASAASATIGLSSNLANGDTLVINGVTLTATNSGSPTTGEFAIGTTTADTVKNLKDALNALSENSSAVTVTGGAETTYAAALGAANYSVSGANSSTLTITSRSGGTLGNSFTLTAGNSNATTTKVNISGQYGGAKINLIAGNTGFASATAAITSGAASQSLTVPFKSGETIKATIGSSSAVSLYTLQADDSLTDIAAGINANSAVSGFKAVIVPSATTGYNIELQTANSSGNISLNGGSNYFATAATGAQTYALNGATSSVDLLSDTLANSTNGGAIVAAAAAASTPFVNASNLYVSIAGGAKAALLDSGSLLATGDTVANIVSKINSSAAAGALGISAALSDNNKNIVITYNDPAQTSGVPSAVTFSSGLNSTTNNTYNTDALGQNLGSGLNGAYVTFNLLPSGLASPDSAAVVANGAGTASSPIESATAISVAFNTSASVLGSATAISSTLTNGWTLQQIAGDINANANAIALGIHAQVVKDASGGYNVQLQYASSALPPAGTSGTAVSTGVQVTYDNSTVNGGTSAAVNATATLVNPKSNYYQSDLFATGFTTASGGTYVISAAANNNGTANVPFGSDAIITLRYNGVDVSSAITVGASATINSLITSINNNTTAQANGISAELVNDGVTANIRIKVADSANHSGVNPGVVDFSVTNAVQTNTFSSHAINTANADNVPTSNYTTYRVFNSTFANTLSDGQAVVATTPSINSPLKAGDKLIVNVNDTSDVTHEVILTDAFTNGQTLTDIVTNINANTTAGLKTGFSATLDGNGTNILLKYVGNATYNILNGRLSVYAATDTIANAGVFGSFNKTDATLGSVNQTDGFNNKSTAVNLFTTSAGVDTSSGVANGGFVVVGTASSATVPIQAGNIVISGVNVAVANGDTIDGVITKINNTAGLKTLGIHAYRVDSGANSQIVLNFADLTNTGAQRSLITIVNASENTANGGGVNNNGTRTFTDAENILQKASTLSAATNNGAVGLTNLGSFGLSGGVDNGIGYGSTTVSGTVADNVLTGISQSKARSIVAFPDIDPSALTSTGNFGTAGAVSLSVGGHSFTFVTSATAVDEIQIGATLKETLDNAVSTINSYGAKNATGDTAFQLNQVNVSRNGNSIVIEGKGISDVTTIAGAASTVTLSGFTNGATTSSANLSNSSRHGTGTFGVDVSGISNKDFSGTIQGFTASYVSNNTVNLSIKVGDYTYKANNVNTNPTAADQVIRFTGTDSTGKDGGGFFDIQLSNNNGYSVSPSNQAADAAAYAKHLDAAFNGLDFAQSRQISSYSGTKSITSGTTLIGSLLGSSVSAKLDSYAANNLTNIEVSAPPVGGGDAKITLTIDGQQYSSSSLGSQLGANQTYRFTNTVDSSKYVEFKTGDSAIDLSTTDNAKAVQTALSEAFGVSNGGGALSFQIGSAASDTLAVSIGSSQTSNLFDGKTLNVLTQANATIASDQLDKALQVVTTLRASVGALQSRFNYAAANIQIAVQNQDAARSALLDTDVAAESTSFATSQVKLQAGISVLAQANQQLQNLLKLIQ